MVWKFLYNFNVHKKIQYFIFVIINWISVYADKGVSCSQMLTLLSKNTKENAKSQYSSCTTQSIDKKNLDGTTNSLREKSDDVIVLVPELEELGIKRPGDELDMN